MDIISYLAELIQTHKEVGVPELGTFFKKKSPGRYDTELHSFLPPHYRLDFKPEVTEDALLSAYISKHHNLSEESANYHINQIVEDLKQQLKDSNEADLKELGKLVLTEGRLTFLPGQHLNLGFEFFGLPQLAEDKSVKENLEAVITENNLEEENPGNLPEEPIYNLNPELPEENKAEEEAQTTVPVEDVKPPLPEKERILASSRRVEPVNYQIQEQPKPANRLYLQLTIGLLILLTLAIVLFLLNPQWLDNINKVNNPQATVLPVNEEHIKTPIDTLSDDLDLAKPDTAKQDTVSKVEVKAVTPEATTFEIIASSVYSQKEADNFIAFMKRKWGVNAKVVSQRPGKKIKISIATFKDEKTARAERARLEEKIQIPGIYIYTNTHKPE